MARETFIVTVEHTGTAPLGARQLEVKLMQGFGMYPPQSVMIEEVEPRRPISYRDPDLSDQWLKEAEWRAERDRSIRFIRKDAGLIIRRLIYEVRKLNRMMNR